MTLELEALTTLDYAANNLMKNDISDEKIVKQVKEIKGTKFTEEVLYKELQILKKYDYLH